MFCNNDVSKWSYAIGNWSKEIEIPFPKGTQEQWCKLSEENDTPKGLTKSALIIFYFVELDFSSVIKTTFFFFCPINILLNFLIELFEFLIFQKAAETFLPVLESKEGIFITMDDLDGLHVWSFKYRCKVTLFYYEKFFI